MEKSKSSSESDIALSETPSKGVSVAVLQMKIVADKDRNIEKAKEMIIRSKNLGADLVVLPEQFNCPYGSKYFKDYAEPIPDGPTCLAMSELAKLEHIYIVAGSIPENDHYQYYSTCTVWDSYGELVLKHRKVHMFDVKISEKVTVSESDIITRGNSLNTFTLDDAVVGIGISFDLRFSEMACIYKKMGVNLMVYPAAFNMTTGPMHWELLLRARAVDNQMFVVGCSGAQSTDMDYVSWGHSMIVDPLGNILAAANTGEEILYSVLDLNDCESAALRIPIWKQRRVDMYDTVLTRSLNLKRIYATRKSTKV